MIQSTFFSLFVYLKSILWYFYLLPVLRASINNRCFRTLKLDAVIFDLVLQLIEELWFNASMILKLKAPIDKMFSLQMHYNVLSSIKARGNEMKTILMTVMCQSVPRRQVAINFVHVFLSNKTLFRDTKHNLTKKYTSNFFFFKFKCSQTCSANHPEQSLESARLIHNQVSRRHLKFLLLKEIISCNFYTSISNTNTNVGTSCIYVFLWKRNSANKFFFYDFGKLL